MTTSDRPARDAPPLVLAVTTGDDRYARSRQIAIDLARDAEARLVLYDWDAAAVLGDPLSAASSAERPDHEPPTELDEDALEAAGRAAIADQVADARGRGVEAAAWLPSEPGAEALAAFAVEHGATTVVLPEDLEAKGRLERVKGGATDTVAAVRRRCRARIVVVPRPLAG